MTIGWPTKEAQNNELSSKNPLIGIFVDWFGKF
jgi:hypothetical protein